MSPLILQDQLHPQRRNPRGSDRGDPQLQMPELSRVWRLERHPQGLGTTLRPGR